VAIEGIDGETAEKIIEIARQHEQVEAAQGGEQEETYEEEAAEGDASDEKQEEASVE